MTKRGEAREKREQMLAEERAAKAEAKGATKAEKAATETANLSEAEAAASLKAARLKPPSAAEMKAIRDSRYAARRARNS